MDLTYVWFFTTALMLIHQHQASTSSAPTPAGGATGPPEGLRRAAPRREKRCSCENQKDKECIFFCHIGIVWVNTPSRLVPYGFGSVRLRRDLSRCLCRSGRDTECLSFCSAHTEGGHAGARGTRSRGAFWETRSRVAVKPQT